MTTPTTLFFDVLDTPLGTMRLLSDGEHVVRIDYDNVKNLDETLYKWTQKHFGEVTFVKDPKAVDKAKEELVAYFSDEKEEFTFPYLLYGTPFQEQVWRALVDTIPLGETKTYKNIAEIIGKPKAVRAVGGAVNKNPLSIVVPCHRVIGTNGKMVGYNGGIEKKEYLLSFEAKDHTKIHQPELNI